jgi:hypothetical protein
LLALEEQKAAEQELLDAATEWRDNALLQIENLRAIEKQLSDDAIAQTELEFLKKKEAAEWYLDVLNSIISATSAWVLGWGTWAWTIPTGVADGTTTINEGDIALSITTWDVTDPQAFVDVISQQLAQEIQDRKRQFWSN